MKLKLLKPPESGFGVHTEDIMDGMQKIKAVAALVESVLVWRAQHIAWNVDISKAEPILFRLIYKEGSENPQAMDLLARIYFQQGKYEKAKELWGRAWELQPGNPALKRAAALMQNMAKSPRRALFRHRLGVIARGALALALFCAVCWGGVKGYGAVSEWAAGPLVVRNLTGSFHYEYDSVTKNMVYVPGPSAVESAQTASPIDMGEKDGSYRLGFTRKRASGSDIGRVEVMVEREGGLVKATGKLPNLYARYLVEQSLWGIPGVTEVDMRNLTVDRAYRVSRGDSLWIIARKIYGEGSNWTLLAKINNLQDPNMLRVGQELSLPLGTEELVPDNNNVSP
ncbi:peptidoglycan-binding protein [Synergistales bacterium]|nr:peptidoglycan-binding protein [Synergistales bacterium]